MSTYHGLCALPHGGRPVAILWLALACATICTCYSISSCRLVTLTYTSNLGNFEDHFVNFDGALEATQYQVGLGLFTWMRPSFYVDGDDDSVTRAEVGNWREGSCTGYTTVQLDDIVDPIVDAVRILGILAVLISFSVFLFSLALACLSLVSWQRYMVSASCILTAMFNGLSLLVLKSDMCHSMGTDPSVPSTCAMDQGGLVAIAGVILWICAALLASFFIEPVQEPGMHDKMVTQDKKKRPSGIDKVRKANNNNMNWNKASGDKEGSSQQKNKGSTTTSNKSSKASKASKPAKTVHASFSLPKYHKEDTFDTSSDAAQKSKRNKSGSIRSAPPSTKAAAPTMLPSFQSKRVRGGTVVSNKSLEAKYIPNSHQEEKKSSDYDDIPLYDDGHSHTSFDEQEMIIRGVAQKLAANGSQKKNGSVANKPSKFQLQASREYPAPNGDSSLMEPHGLNRADSRSMLSSLTSPSFVGGLHTRHELQSMSARQKALTEADLIGQPKNGTLCCGIGF